MGVDRYTSHDFFSTLLSLCTHHIVAQGVLIKHVHPHVITCLSVVVSLCLTSSLSSASTPPLISYLVYPGHHPPCCRNRQALNPMRTCRKRSIAPWRYITLSQAMRPTISTTLTTQRLSAILQNESVGSDTEPSYLCDAELDDELIGKALSSPLFVQEREEPANLRQTYHSHEESVLSAQSFFTRTSTGRPVYEPSSHLSQKRKSNRDLENERIRILLESQKKQILAEVRSEIQKHEFQAESDKRSIQE